MVQNYDNGGIKIIDLNSFISALKNDMVKAL